MSAPELNYQPLEGIYLQTAQIEAAKFCTRIAFELSTATAPIRLPNGTPFVCYNHLFNRFITGYADFYWKEDKLVGSDCRNIEGLPSASVLDNHIDTLIDRKGNFNTHQPDMPCLIDGTSLRKLEETMGQKLPRTGGFINKFVLERAPDKVITLITSKDDLLNTHTIGKPVGT